MNVIDIILLLCFIPAIINGIRKGFIAQVIAIISLVLGIWLSCRFAALAGAWMSGWIETSARVLNIISFVVIFVLVVLVLNVLGKILENTVKIIMLGWLNRLLGVAFSVMKCILILGFSVTFFNYLNAGLNLVDEAYIADSVLYQPLEDIANTVFPVLKELIFT